MYLALDIALQTGYAYGAGGDITFGTHDLREMPADNAVRGRMFRRWVAGLLDELEPHELCIEKPIFFHGARSGATTLLHGLAWEAHRAAELRNIPRHDVYPQTLKKHVTGNGHAKKDEVMEAVKTAGHNVQNDNEADAVAMLMYKISLGEGT